MSEISRGEILEWIEQGYGPGDLTTLEDRALFVDTAIGVTVYERRNQLADTIAGARTEQRAAARLIERAYKPHSPGTPLPASLLGSLEPHVEAAFLPFSLITNRGIDSLTSILQRLEASNPGFSSLYLRKVRKIITRGIPGTPKVIPTEVGVSFEDATLTAEELEQCPRIARRTANVILRFLNYESPDLSRPRTQTITHSPAA